MFIYICVCNEPEQLPKVNKLNRKRQNFEILHFRPRDDFRADGATVGPSLAEVQQCRFRVTEKSTRDKTIEKKAEPGNLRKKKKQTKNRDNQNREISRGKKVDENSRWLESRANLRT